MTIFFHFSSCMTPSISIKYFIKIMHYGIDLSRYFCSGIKLCYLNPFSNDVSMPVSRNFYYTSIKMLNIRGLTCLCLFYLKILINKPFYFCLYFCLTMVRIVITRKLWNRKSAFRLQLCLKIVQWTWGTAIAQCKQTHFTYWLI